MPHTDPHPVTLTDRNNRPNKYRGKSSDWSKGKGVDDRSLRWKDGDVIEKPIQAYRLWYKYLALALELGRQNVSLLSRTEKITFDKPKKDKYGHYRSSKNVQVFEPIEVERDKYPDWDLDQIPTTTFDDWWKTHRHLFLLTPVKIIGPRDEWNPLPHIKYFQIDTRFRKDDLSDSIDRILRDLVDQDKEKSVPYQFTGNVKVDSLQNRYNAMILRITDDKRKDSEILDDQQFFSKENDSSISGSTMRDLLDPAKETLLSVCQGCFPKLPKK